MSRQRTHNYWPCDGDIDSDEEYEDRERGGEEKDPFEVGWENGENNPMNPRAIVLICSLAVYDNLLSIQIYAVLNRS
jgi:hypothetical protein